VGCYHNITELNEESALPSLISLQNSSFPHTGGAASTQYPQKGQKEDEKKKKTKHNKPKKNKNTNQNPAMHTHVF